MSAKSIDQLLDLLIDALEERKVTRENQAADSKPVEPTSRKISEEFVEPVISPAHVVEPATDLISTEQEIAPVISESFVPTDKPISYEVVIDEPEYARIDEESFIDQSEIEPPEFIPTIDNMPRTMVRLFIALLVVIAFANLQLFDLTRLNALFASGNEGKTTVRFAREGMLLQGDNPRVYLMEDNKRRWITTSEAFTAYGYRWGAVRYVGDDYLAQFEEGEPIYLAMKCPSSPHVFALDVRGESQRVRRWISDIETFEQMGFVWEEINQDRCSFLRSLQNGQPFPANVGERIPNP